MRSTNRDAPSLHVRLSGRQLVLLGATQSSLSSWPFFVPAAKVRVEQRRSEFRKLRVHLLSELQRLWASVGLPLADPTVDRAIQARRRKTRAVVRLERAHVRTLLRGIPILLLEFRDKWSEFCVVTAPFNVDYYGLRLRDLHALGRRLQTELDRAARAKKRRVEPGGPRRTSKRARRG